MCLIEIVGKQLEVVFKFPKCIYIYPKIKLVVLFNRTTSNQYLGSHIWQESVENLQYQ